MPEKILVIEDEQGLVDVLSYNLRREGFEVLSATDGKTGLRTAQLYLPDLIVLDLMLPVLSGLEVCRQIRSEDRTRPIPILILTARAEEVDQLVGFSMGADDYVTKPFSPKVLVQRIRALLRRHQGHEDEASVLECQGIRVDRQRHRVFAHDREVELTPTEFRLLETLLRRPGRAFRRSELLDAVMGEVIVLERTIDVHVKSLRKKLGDLGELIETVRSVGYRLRESRAAP